MDYQYDMTPPPMVRYTKNLGRKQYTINYDLTKMDNDSYRWATVTLAPGLWSYGSIIAAIVATKYGPNELQAITANMLGILSGSFDHLPAEKIEEYKKECRELALWRDHAKEIAKAALDYNPT